MKANIHPQYRDVLFHDTSSDTYFIVGSTLDTKRTMEYEGATYPYMPIDVSSASHPFYTGKKKDTQNDGRVARFEKRYSRKSSS